MTCYCLLLVSVLSQAVPEVEPVFSVRSLKRNELPNDFPFQVLDVGYAVLEVTLDNAGEEPLKPVLGEMQIANPKGKKLVRAEPSEITPGLMKYYRGGQLGVSGEVYAGGRPPYTTDPRRQVPTVEPGAAAGSVSVGVPERLRAILEHYQVREDPVAPGSSVKGLVYVKSKQSGNRLAGGSFTWGRHRVRIE